MDEASKHPHKESQKSSPLTDRLIGLYQGSPNTATESESILTEAVTPESGWSWKREQDTKPEAIAQLATQDSKEEWGWPEGFFETVVGACADDPIVRPNQQEYEIREELQ